MVYEAYEARMEKIAKIFAWIKKYRVIIISVICAVLLLISAFLTAKGIIIEDAALPDGGVLEYGDEFNFGGKALFCSVGYEYRAEGEQSFTEKTPFMPGTYYVRLTSIRSFGIKSYGEEFKITLTPREMLIYEADGKMVYGDDPVLFDGALAYSDRLESFDYELSDRYSFSTVLSVDPDSVQIINKDGDNVTSAYLIKTEPQEISVRPRPIKVRFDDAEKVYDGTPLSAEGWTYTDGGLAQGDTAKRVDKVPSAICYSADGYENSGSLIFLSEDGKDISELYSPSYKSGRLTVLKRQIKLTSSDAKKVFDGARLKRDKITVSEGSIANGDTLSAVYLAYALYSGTYENEFNIVIKNENGVEVTDSYQVAAEYGRLTVTPRPVRIKISDMTLIYDGKEHTADGLSNGYTLLPPEENEGMVTGYKLNVTLGGSICEVGSVESSLESFNVTAANGKDVSSSFSVSADPGTLTIIKRPIVVEAPTAELEYDGNHRTLSDISVDPTVTLGRLDGSMPTVPGSNLSFVLDPKADPLVHGHSLSAEFDGGGRNIGVYDSSIKRVTVTDSSGRDVSANYEIATRSSKFVITHRKISVAPDNESFVYDGKTHTPESDGCEVKYIGSTNGADPLCNGHRIALTVEGNIKTVGTSAKIIKRLVIYDAENVDVTYNYDITALDGELTVTPRPILVTMLDGEFVYDAKGHTGYDLENRFKVEYLKNPSSVDPSVPALAEGESITVTSEGKIIFVGTVTHTSSKVAIKGSDGDTTDNYTIRVKDSYLTVTPRPIKISTGSATKVYDDTELICHEYEIISGSLAGTDVLTPTFLSYRVYAGVTDNNIRTTFSSGLRDVTECYSVELMLGVLEVTKRPIEVTAKSESFVYDGTYKYGNIVGFSVTGGTAPVEGHELTVANYSKIIDCGSVSSTIEWVKIIKHLSGAVSEDVSSNYDITAISGTLTVTERSILVKTVNTNKIYDGDPLYGGDNGSLRIYYYPNGVIDNSTFGIPSSDIYHADKSSIRYVNESGAENRLVIYSIRRDGKEVLDNYIINYDFGTLEILKRPITVTAKDVEFVYNGQYRTAPTTDNAIFNVADLGSSSPILTAVTEGRIKNVGTVPHVLNEVRITLSDGTDITENFDVTKKNGILRVTPLQVVAHTLSAKKIYDGTPLVRNELTLDGMVEESGYVVTSRSRSSQTAVGSCANILEIVSIVNGNGEDVTRNYRIIFENGELTVISGDITVQTYDFSKTYNAQPISYNKYTVSGELLDGHVLSVTVTGSGVNAGTYRNTFEARIMNGAEDVTHLYNISGDYGTLTVLKQPLYVWSSSLEKLYDGTPLTSHSLRMTKGLIGGHSISEIDYTGILDEPGKTFNTFTVRKIVDQYGNDVTANYEPEYEYGTLTLYSGDIVVKTSDYAATYDGKTHTYEKYRVEGQVLNEHRLVITVTGSITNAGTADNTATVAILDTSGRDVSGKYNVSVITGTLTLHKKKIEVSSVSANWIYDGGPHSACEIESNGLIESHSIADVDYLSALTEVGQIDNLFKIKRIEDGNGNDVTQNYEVSYSYGVIRIISGDLTLVSQSHTKVYDGQELSPDDCILMGEVLWEHEVELSKTDRITSIGAIPNSYVIKITESGEDVTHRYNLNYDFGTLEITKRPITVISASAEKIYGGDRLVCEELVESADLANGDRIAEVEFYGSITDQGSIENKFTVKSILNANGDEAIKNYDIKYEYGILTVLRRPIEVNTGSAEKIYDGEPLYCDKFELDESMLVSGHIATVTLNGSITEVGSTENVATVTVLDANGRDVSDNYEPFGDKGTLRVISGELVISTGSASKPYDGEPLTHNVATYTGETLTCHTVKLKTTGSITHIGKTYNTVSYEICDGEGRVIQTDLTPDSQRLYKVALNIGELEVKKVKLLVTTGSATKYYDGAPLTCEEYEYDGVLLDGHTLKVEPIGSITEIGATENMARISITSISGDVIYSQTDPNGCEYYEVTVVQGILSVLDPDHFRLPITVKSESDSKEYDGTPLVNNVYTYTGELTVGHELFVEFEDGADRILPGVYKNRFEIIIRDQSGADVTELYDVKREYGDLEISKMIIVVCTGSATKVFDSTPLFCHEYSIESGSLLDGHSLFLSYPSLITDVGSIPNEATVSVTDSNGIIIEDLYDIEVVTGTLTVTETVIRLSPFKLIKSYTGTVRSYQDDYPDLINSVWVCEGADKLPLGYYIEAVVIGSYHEVGEHTSYIESAIIYDSDGNNITESYTVEFVVESFIILPINITISTASATKTYNGTKLEAKEYSISVGALFEGHKLTANVIGYAVLPTGNTPVKNEITDVRIVDKDNNDVTSYYEIEYQLGDLVILPP